jgi:hypothetical protein
LLKTQQAWIAASRGLADIRRIFMLPIHSITRRPALMSFGAFGVAAAVRPSMTAERHPAPGAGPTDFDIVKEERWSKRMR